MCEINILSQYATLKAAPRRAPPVHHSTRVWFDRTWQGQHSEHTPLESRATGTRFELYSVSGASTT
jgi:hypothetical protein